MSGPAGCGLLISAPTPDAKLAIGLVADGGEPAPNLTVAQINYTFGAVRAVSASRSRTR